MSLAINSGHIPHAVLFFSSIDELSNGKYTNLTDEIKQINIKYDLRGTYEVAIAMNGERYLSLFNTLTNVTSNNYSDKTPFVIMSVGGFNNVQKRQRVLALVSVEKIVNPLTKVVNLVLELTPYEYLYSKLFSKKFDGSYADILSDIIDIIYLHNKDSRMNSYKPSISYYGFNTSTEIYQLLQRQRYIDYAEELRKSAVDDETYTPMMIWNTFSDINVASLSKLLEQEPINIVLKSTDELNTFAGVVDYTASGIPIYYATTYDSPIDIDYAKYITNAKKKFYSFDIATGKLNTVNSLISEDILDYDIINGNGMSASLSYLYPGYALAISEHFRGMLSTSMSEITMYYPDIPIEPGAIINLVTGIGNEVSQEQYLVASVLAQTSNDKGYQSIKLVKTKPIKQMINYYSEQKNLQAIKSNEVRGENEKA